MEAESSENPLRAGMRLEPKAPPCAVVIFGATGDLTRRKLLPAVYRLAQQGLVPGEFAILGTARHPMSDDEFRSLMRAAVSEFGSDDTLDESAWQSFAKRLFYIAGDFKDPGLYNQLKTKLDEVTPPTTRRTAFFIWQLLRILWNIARQSALRTAGRRKADDASHVEKPFGSDLESARALTKIWQQS